MVQKNIVSVVLIVLILSACHSSELSFSKIESVPRVIESHIDSKINLQLIHEELKGDYVIIHSHGEIEADIDPRDNTIHIIFNEINPQDEEIRRNVYYLTKDSKHDTINVFVNGEAVSFDNITGI